VPAHYREISLSWARPGADRAVLCAAVRRARDPDRHGPEPQRAAGETAPILFTVRPSTSPPAPVGL